MATDQPVASELEEDGQSVRLRDESLADFFKLGSRVLAISQWILDFSYLLWDINGIKIDC